jgi:hypothetical protein
VTPAKLAAHDCRSARLRKADSHQTAAGKALREASDLLLGVTYNSLESGAAFKAIKLMIANARMQIMVADRLHWDQACEFIDHIMKGPAKKRRSRR